MKPILKWAGGKSALLEEIKSKMPIEYNTYYEPFIGGGAVFFGAVKLDEVIQKTVPK